MSEEKIIKAIIKKSWLILLVTVIITGVAAFFVKSTSQSVYQAKTTLYAMPTSNSQRSVITSDNIAVSQQLAQDYGELIKSEKIITAVIEKLGLKGVTPQELSNSASILTVKGSNLLELSVIDTNPEKAQALANTFAQVLIEKIVSINNQNNLSVVDEAKVPANPIPTNKSKQIAAAFLFSLLMMAGLVVLLEFIDNTVRTVAEVEKELGYYVIGIIPENGIK